MSKIENFEICIIGGGPTGLISAIMCSQLGVKTALISPKIDSFDGRSTAFLESSLKTLKILNIWERLKVNANPITKLRLIDDTGRLIRAPEVVFDCTEIELEAFGYNILNQNLVQKLSETCSSFENPSRFETMVNSLKLNEQSVEIRLDNNQEVSCHLCVGADGRNSIVREFMGLEVSQRKYDQSALVLNLRHSVSNQNSSTEFHTPNGPFTLVPLTERQSSLVCVDTPQEIERLKELDIDELESVLEKRSKSILGKLSVISEKQVFPISSATVEKLATKRCVIVGDAAHGLPPIGAQGLNLGIRDIATLGEILVQAKAANQDLGSQTILADFERARKIDIQLRSKAVDLLNRSLLTGFLPIQALRFLGAQISNKIPIIRNNLMKFGAFDTFSVQSDTCVRLIRKHVYTFNHL